MSSILITGSEGLVGSGLIAQLHKQSRRVRRLDVRCAPGSPANGDVRNSNDIRRAVEGCSGIIHLAAVSRVVWGERDPQACWTTNFEGTKNVLRAAAEASAKPWVIFASSREAYGEPEACPVTEDHPLRPVNIYGRSKVAAEEAVLEAREAGLHTAIVRLSNVYGSTSDHHDRVVPAFARAAVDGTPLRVDGSEHTFDFTHLDDTVQGILAVSELLEQGEVNLSPIHLLTGSPTSLGELARLAVDAGSGTSEVREAPPRDFDVAHFYGDPSRARELLGWEAQVSIEDGLAKLVRAFEETLDDSAVVEEAV